MVFLIVILFKAARVVPQRKEYIVERLGKYSRTLNAGLHILVPFLDVVRYKRTLKEEVYKLLKIQNVIFDIDVVGGIKLKNFFKDDALSVFVKPPSIDILRQRLVSRDSDSLKSIQSRVLKAELEILREPEFDLTLTNDNLEVAKKESYDIVKNFLING